MTGYTLNSSNHAEKKTNLRTSYTNSNHAQLRKSIAQ